MASYYSGANLQPDAMQTLYLNNPDYTGYADMTNPGSMLLLNQSVASVPTSSNIAASGQPHHYVGIQYPQAPSPKHSSVDSLESSGSQLGINSALLASRFRNPGYGTWRNVGNELSFIQAADPSPLTQPLSEKITGYSAVDHQSVSEIVPTAIKRSSVSSVQNQQLNINSNAISLQLDQSHVSEAQVHGLSLSLSPQQLSNIQLSCFQNHPSEQNVDCPSISEETSHENINMLDRVSAKFSDNAGSFRSSRDVMPATNFLTMANGHQLDKSSQHSSNTYTPLSNSLTGSKYFRAAQELLDEVVNVGKGTKFDKGKYPKSQALSDMKNMTNEANINDTPASAITGSSACANETKSENPAGISAADRQELQMKKAKLVAMLNEVDRRYRQYYHQMQIVVSMFEAAAGCGSAKTYTSLALKTISRHFRSLRDAIATQIRLASKNLGEEDLIGTEQGETSRLHFVDQQLRQQRALQQLGMLQQHAWRPQRGLPERAVSILRAWLFEHFLHPYPKDADKIYLARQTGLTRSQVSNWFINARVRLWKPMVEEMYTEEVKEAESNANATEAKSTTESAQNKKEAEVNDTRNRDCRRDEKSSNCPNTKNNEVSQLHQQGTDNMNFKSDHASIGIDNESHRLGIASLSDNGMFNTSGEDLRQGHHKKLRNGLHDSIGILPTSMAANVDLRPEEGSGYILDNSKFSNEDKHVSEDYSYSNNKMLQLEDSSEFGSYHIDGLSRYGQDPYAHKFSGFGGVSLTLGLQHCDDLTLSGTHQSYSSGQLGLPSGRSDLGTESGHLHHMHNGTGVGGENEFETINLHNGKRYASQMLHDFVA